MWVYGTRFVGFKVCAAAAHLALRLGPLAVQQRNAEASLGQLPPQELRRLDAVGEHQAARRVARRLARRAHRLQVLEQLARLLVFRAHLHHLQDAGQLGFRV